MEDEDSPCEPYDKKEKKHKKHKKEKKSKKEKKHKKDTTEDLDLTIQQLLPVDVHLEDILPVTTLIPESVTPTTDIPTEPIPTNTGPAPIPSNEEVELLQREDLRKQLDKTLDLLDFHIALTSDQPSDSEDYEPKKTKRASHPKALKEPKKKKAKVTEDAYDESSSEEEPTTQPINKSIGVSFTEDAPTSLPDVKMHHVPTDDDDELMGHNVTSEQVKQIMEDTKQELAMDMDVVGAEESIPGLDIDVKEGSEDFPQVCIPGNG